MEMLQNIKSIGCAVQGDGNIDVKIDNLCRKLHQLSQGNVFIADNSGKVIACTACRADQDAVVAFADQAYFLDKHQNEKLLHIVESEVSKPVQLCQEKGKDNFGYLEAGVFPIHSASNRLGTLILNKMNEVSEGDMVLGEITAILAGIYMSQRSNDQAKDDFAKAEAVKSSIATLTYSELDSLVHIFQELDGLEGLVVASRIADKIGITRSVVVNAIRKLESAGIIESRSLGMKGTYIKVINIYLLAELEKFRT